MDVEARNKYCGYIMFNTASSKGTGSKSNDLILNNCDASSFSNYDSDLFPHTGPTNHSMAAGAAAVEDQTSKKEENPFQIYDPSNLSNGGENGKKLPGSSKMQPEKRPPRPPNAFILYRRAKQPAILAAHRNLTNAEISRYISSCWKSETDEERLSWERYADQKKLEHMQAYPNYVYRPNKNKGKNEKRRQARKQSAAATFNSQESTNVDESGPIRATKKNKGQNRLNNLVGRIEIPMTNKATGIQNFDFSMMTPPLSSPNTPNNNNNNLVYTTAPVPYAEPEQLHNSSFSTQDMQLQQQMQMLYRIQHQQQQQEALFQNNLTNLTFQSINELTPGSFREETVDPLIFAFPNNEELMYSPHSSFDSISTNNSDLNNLNSQKINTSCAYPEFRDNTINTQGLADIFAGIHTFESTFQY